MNRNWQKDLEIHGPAAAFLPPPILVETGWDILIALRSEQRNGLSVEKLAPLVSVHRMVLGQWLSWLEDRRLVTGARDELTGELRVVLTPGGRDLLDRYLSAAMDLQAQTH